MARKLTPEAIEKISHAIRLGATYDLAASYAGISRVTLWGWLKKGEKANSGKFKELYDAVNEAEGKAAIGWLAKIEQAANDGNWAAAAWKLERRYPNDYGRQRLDIESDNKVEIVVKRTDEN